VFSVKINRYITHIRRLRDVGRVLNEFIDTCETLEHKLGPFLVGLSPSFKKDVGRLDEFLSLLPDNRFAFEFRHDSWFSDDVLDRFIERSNLSLVVLGARFDNNINCRKNFAYIRWHARDGSGVYPSQELDYWAHRIRSISDDADVFGYWNHSEQGPKNCLDLVSRLTGESGQTSQP
jgi:uncharacterized protein YecE (DUF72 family)